MAYLSSQRVAEIRNELKAIYPDFKMSITRDNWSGVKIAILEAPIKLTESEKESINHFYISDIKDPVKREIMATIYNIANKGVKIYETGDYGNQPSHYVDISIGQWDRPFKMTVKGTSGKTVAAFRIKSVKS